MTSQDQERTITEAPAPEPRRKRICRATIEELREYAELRIRFTGDGNLDHEDLRRIDELEDADFVGSGVRVMRVEGF